MTLSSRLRQEATALKAARWAMSSAWVKEWLHDMGIRPLGHSTLLWFREAPGHHTRVTMRNYLSLNYGIPNPTYAFTLHDLDGHKVAEWKIEARPDETLIVDSAAVARRFDLGHEFEGNLAAEVRHPKLDPPRFLRANVDYYNEQGLITTVHDQGRLAQSPRADAQSLVYVREDDDYETGIALQNWFRYRRRPTEFMAEATIDLLNASGESQRAEAPPIPACGTRFLLLRSLFPNAQQFLGGLPGGLRIHSNIAMGRSIPVVRSRRTGSFTVSHTTGDHDPRFYQRELLPRGAVETASWAPLWCSFVEESEQARTHYSFFNNWLPRSTYTIDLRVFDAAGGLRAVVPGAVELRPFETQVLSVRRLLDANGLYGPFAGMVEARIAVRADQESMPGPGMLQVNTIWETDGGMTQSNNQSFGAVNSPAAGGSLMSPKRTKMFGRVISDDRYDTMLSLMNPSSDERYTTASDTEITICDASGTRRQSRRLTIPPHGSVWVSCDELFPNLSGFLEESRGVSSLLVVDKLVKLTGYLGVRDRYHGSIGTDHLFGG